MSAGGGIGAQKYGKKSKMRDFFFHAFFENE
jgi:hypothetical protein